MTLTLGTGLSTGNVKIIQFVEFGRSSLAVQIQFMDENVIWWKMRSFEREGRGKKMMEAQTQFTVIANQVSVE